jgi:hypothetical protein
MSRRWSIGILAALLLVGVGGWLSFFGSAAALTDLHPASFEQLKQQFNAAGDSVRVIVLLSPT